MNVYLKSLRFAYECSQFSCQQLYNMYIGRKQIVDKFVREKCVLVCFSREQ